MPLAGEDKQINLSWQEQDRIRRRLEIKDRLKQECIRQRWDPFRHMNKQVEQDDAILRYMDLRKKGRLPGAPMRPTYFFGGLAMLFVPIFVLAKLADIERKPYLEKKKAGTYNRDDFFNMKGILG